MAKSKERTFRSTHDGPIVVAVPHGNPITFTPGEVRTVTVTDPHEIRSLEANPNVEEVKK